MSKIDYIIDLSNAMVQLMHPLLEIVIHDLKSGTICYINGCLSKRIIGDPSLIDAKDIDEDINEIAYSKLSFDGRLIKSISVPIEEKWLVCINCDISIFNQMKDLGELFVKNLQQHKPESLFKNDWQEKLHLFIHSFINEKAWNFNELSNSQKKELIKHLFNNDAFNEKKAADYIAKTLKLGRATVFKYLKEWKNQ